MYQIEFKFKQWRVQVTINAQSLLYREDNIGRTNQPSTVCFITIYLQIDIGMEFCNELFTLNSFQQ